MYTTRTEMKSMVRDELKCPAEYIRHLSRFDVFGDLKEAALSDDKQVVYDIMSDIRDGYIDYCRMAGIDCEADNRKARIGFFIM